MNLAAAGALIGDGDPGACGGISARKNSLGRSSPRCFGDLFLLYVLKTSSVQSLPLVLMLSSSAFGCVLQESSVNYMSQGSLQCE